MKILIAGSRTWEDEEAVRNALNEAWVQAGKPEPETVELIHGDDPSGADIMSDMYAVEQGWNLTIFSPNWNVDGKDCYDVRNRDMVNYGADIALVFFSRRSARIDRLVESLNEAGIPIKTFWEEDE